MRGTEEEDEDNDETEPFIVSNGGQLSSLALFLPSSPQSVEADPVDPDSQGRDR